MSVGRFEGLLIWCDGLMNAAHDGMREHCSKGLKRMVERLRGSSGSRTTAICYLATLGARKKRGQSMKKSREAHEYMWRPGEWSEGHGRTSLGRREIDTRVECWPGSHGHGHINQQIACGRPSRLGSRRWRAGGDEVELASRN